MEGFKKFGKKINLIAICFVLTLVISSISSILIMIFTYSALKIIKNILYEVGDKHLFEFRSKFISAYMVSFFGIFCVGTGIFVLIILLITWSSSALYALIPIFFGLIFIIIGSAFEMKAWKNLNIFFKENRQMFPEAIVRDAIEGSEKLRFGNLLMVFSFMVIPAIAGWIYKAIGYFKLASLRNMMELQPEQFIHQQQDFQSQQLTREEPLEVKIRVGKYCPHCGTKINKEEMYCPGCGTSYN